MTHVGGRGLKGGQYAAIYRSPDDANNFEIRILVEEAETETARVFKWQEKVYGRFERELYRDKSNCVTDLEKRYHEDVIKLIPENDKDILFSYVDEDEFSRQKEESVVLNSKKTTELCKQMDKLSCYEDDDDESAKNLTNTKEPDGFNYKRFLLKALSTPYAGHNFQTMYIMADLGEYVGNTWLKSEHVLCTIKYDPCQKFLLIHPDFTGSEPYRLQIEGERRRELRYRVQDASEKMPIDLLLKENEILNKVALHQSKLRLQDVGNDFEMPSNKKKLDVYMFFEILSARNFEYNDIYVEYIVDLPEEWHCQDPSSLRGTTHTSHSFTDDNLSYFGFPFEVCLEYNVENFGKFTIPKAPHVYFEVISKDSWNRFRTEGLTYAILPISQPGLYRYDLHCLRICPKGPGGNLRRFFIGDCSSYTDPTWASVPKYHDKSVINKYGMNTVGAGEISVRIGVLHQSPGRRGEGAASSSRKPSGRFVLEKLNASSLVKSVEQVLEAFKAAKRRMVEARRNI